MQLAPLSDSDRSQALRRYEAKVQERATYEPKWQNLAHLMRPTRASIRWQYTPGQPRTQQMFDGTAMKAAHDLSSALSGSFTSTEYPFFGLKMRYQPLNEDWDTRMWLEECAARMFLALQQSNFGSASSELYQDLVVFGTGCMWMESEIAPSGGFGGFRFRTIPIARYVIGEAHDGTINRVWREFKLPVAEVLARWPKTASDRVREKVEKQPDEPIRILHSFLPAEYGVSQGHPRKRFESRYFELDTKAELEAAAYSRCRFVVPRWDKASDELYGTGQGDVAYPDTASLNRAVEMRFKQWAKAIDPPILTVDDGVIGKLRMTAGTRTVVRNLDAVREFQTSAKFDVAQFNEEQLRTMIRNYFYADQIQLPNKSYMTAFEIQSLLEIMQRLLGPKLGRLKEDYAGPLLDFVFDELWAAGALPPPPPIVIEAVQQGLAKIDVEYDSPLTRVQRTSEVAAVEKTMQLAGPLVGVKPDVVDNIDADAVLRGVAETNGVPAKYLRSAQALQQVRQARQAAEAQRVQAEVGNLQSQSVKNIADAAKSGAQAMAPPAGGQAA